MDNFRSGTFNLGFGCPAIAAAILTADASSVAVVETEAAVEVGVDGEVGSVAEVVAVEEVAVETEAAGTVGFVAEDEEDIDEPAPPAPPDIPYPVNDEPLLGNTKGLLEPLDVALTLLCCVKECVYAASASSSTA